MTIQMTKMMKKTQKKIQMMKTRKKVKAEIVVIL